VSILLKFHEISLETKKEIVNSYLSGNIPVSTIRFNYSISCDTLYKILKFCGVRVSGKKPRKPVKSLERTPIHKKLVNEFVQKYQTPTNTVINFNKRPIPDILIINWEARTISAVEVEINHNNCLKTQNHKIKHKLQLYTNPKTKKPINKLIIVASPTDSKEYNLTI